MADKQRSLENLKQGHGWKPGQSGNPKGRPPKPICLTGLFKELLTEIDPNDTAGRQRCHRFAERALLQAENGNAAYFKEIMDRMEGKVKLPIEAEGIIELRVRYDDEKPSETGQDK